ncbi:MAG: GIY-YIG nuclease family protein [Gallionella sp.]|nr:GIY-YIG nuclease family protein [Gallionella sp.]
MSLPNNWICYLLRCADDTLYCGITNDLDKRLASHNAGTAAKYTRARGPVALVFVEGCADRSVASKREMAIKKLTRADKLALIRSTLSQPEELSDFVMQPCA